MNLEEKWITGFVDGEGCFHVAVNKHDDMKSGYQVLPEFTVVQHRRDVQILHALKRYFGCGVVRKNHGDRMAYRVRGKKDLLERIVPFFEQHPLKTKKHVEIKAILYNDKNEILDEKQTKCGSYVTREELKNLPPRFTRGDFKIRPPAPNQMRVAPGITIPFIVIFPNISPDVREYEVEIVEAPNA